MANPAGLPEVCVVYLVRNAAVGPEVLLGRKLTGLGAGKVVAPGGKLESGETPIDAAVREVREEVGLTLDVAGLRLLGELTYIFPTKSAWNQVSWAFTAHGDFGDPMPSHELDALWISVGSLPLDEMWGDAKYWVPDLLNGVPVVATFQFGSDLSTVSERG